MLCPSVASADWIKLDTTTTGTVWYFDPDRVVNVNGKVRTWVRGDATKDRSVRWSEAKELWSFDCSQRTMKVISSVSYDNYGKVLKSNSFPDYGTGYGYEPVVPDTLGEAGERAACSASQN